MSVINGGMKMDFLEPKIAYAELQLKKAEATVEMWKEMLRRYDKIKEKRNDE